MRRVQLAAQHARERRQHCRVGGAHFAAFVCSPHSRADGDNRDRYLRGFGDGADGISAATSKGSCTLRSPRAVALAGAAAGAAWVGTTFLA